MPGKCGSCGHFLLLGLDPSMVTKLGDALSSQSSLKSFVVYSHSFPTPSECLELIGRLNIDLVFCAPKPDFYGPLVRGMRRENGRTPVIIVSPPSKANNEPAALQTGIPDCFEVPFDKKLIIARPEPTRCRKYRIEWWSS